MSRNIFASYKKIIIVLAVGFLFLVFGLVLVTVQNYYPSKTPVSTSPSIIPASNTQVIEDENIKTCITDQGAYIGGCRDGYTCFGQGNDQACSRGIDCSSITFNPVGDNKCHKECRSNNDCLSGYTCLEREVWHGDSVQTYKLCL